jgi:peptide deformylase
MILTDKIYNPDPTSPLNKPCELVTDYEEAKRIVEVLHKVFDEFRAYGVAANQVGYNKNIFCIATESGIKNFINSSIIEYSEDTHVFEEGCLSFPNFFVKVKRPRWITLIYEDLDGKEHKEIFDGFMARVIQHESDHIAGRRFFDGANRIHIDQAMRKYKVLKRREPKPSSNREQFDSSKW